MLSNYIVFSSNSDQNQIHVDIVTAEDRESAQGIVMEARDYVQVGEAFTSGELRRWADEMDAPEAEFSKTAKEVAISNGDDFEDEETDTLANLGMCEADFR